MNETRNLLSHIVTILKSEMGLDDARVYIYNQKYQLPTDEGLLIAVGIETAKPFGVQSQMDANAIETQMVNTAAQVWIELTSKDASALDRKEEVLLALGSLFSQQTQEKYSFHIGRLPPTPIANLSEIEGASIPYRFRIMVQVQYLIKKTKSVNYYSTFSKSVTTEN